MRSSLYAFSELSEQVIFDIVDAIDQHFPRARFARSGAMRNRSTRGSFASSSSRPTELKHEHTLIAARPEFPILFGRIRDRISTLRSLYGAGPLDIDFRGIGDRAAAVRMTRCEVRRQEADRRSTRTGQRHSIGGFVGIRRI